MVLATNSGLGNFITGLGKKFSGQFIFVYLLKVLLQEMDYTLLFIRNLKFFQYRKFLNSWPILLLRVLKSWVLNLKKGFTVNFKI